MVLTVSGTLTDDALIGAVTVRAYLDLDPAFNQLWTGKGIDMRFDGHTQFVTVGSAVGFESCPVPTCGRRWSPSWGSGRHTARPREHRVEPR